MSNRTSSRQHGLHRVKRLQPTSKRKQSLGAKRRRVSAAAGQDARQDAIRSAIAEFEASVV